MSRHSKRRKKNVAPDSSDFRVDPFSDLDEFVEVPEPDPEDKADAPPAPSESVPETSRSRVPPLVIRHQRKGRSGKTVTLVQGLESLDTTEQMELLREIGRASCRERVCVGV